MIASAMKTHHQDLLQYNDLARRKASIVRHVTSDSLPRCQTISDKGWEVVARLKFRLDEDGWAWAEGCFEVKTELECQYCLQWKGASYKGNIDVCLVQDDGLASELAHGRDVALVRGDEIDLAEIIEDEILLGVPEKLCDNTQCENDPSNSYSADEEIIERRDSPFSILKNMKD